MKTKIQTEDSRKRRDGPNWLLRLVRRVAFWCGYAVIPVAEIDAMEAEGISSACYRKHRQLCRQEDGYFNGLADAFSKKAHYFREKYLPNVK